MGEQMTVAEAVDPALLGLAQQREEVIDRLAAALNLEWSSG